MPRVRSQDYASKSRAIMDRAATLFAKAGYPAAKMQDVAKACGATKSMLYHYFPTKDDLLFAILAQHLQDMVQGIDEVIAMQAPADAVLPALVDAYARKSIQSRQRHMVAMQDVKYLPKSMQRPLLDLQRGIADRVTALLRRVNPGLSDASYKLYAMTLIGMLNWADIWYRPNGSMKFSELTERVTRLFLQGFMAEKS